jgi:cyclic lactone autoinducer peptide
MKVKGMLLKSLASLGYNSAMKAGGTASQYGTYQAVEPREVSVLREKNTK